MLRFKTYLFITHGKKIRKPYKNIKLKIITPICNDEFELPDGSCSVSDIQDYIEYIIKKQETLTENSSAYVYINVPETMKFFDSINVLSL